MGRRIAVVLFNIGGPDGPESVRPFLRNLFKDPAIIGAPGPIREALAWLISTTRTKEASENYAKMGGGSPLVPETQKQAAALTEALGAAMPGGAARLEHEQEGAGIAPLLLGLAMRGEHIAGEPDEVI
jgi:ferrochelatase